MKTVAYIQWNKTATMMTASAAMIVRSKIREVKTPLVCEPGGGTANGGTADYTGLAIPFLVVAAGT